MKDDNMMAGQVGLVRHSRGLLGKMVELATDSTSHHVVISIGGNLCVSADVPRVMIRGHHEFHSLEWSRFQMTPEQVHTITRFATSIVNRPYNVPAVVLLILSRLTRVPIPRFAVAWLERRPHLDCSQAADLALAAAGINLFPHDSALVVPAHFEHYFREQGWLS
jgi:hypothetical protein